MNNRQKLLWNFKSLSLNKKFSLVVVGITLFILMVNIFLLINVNYMIIRLNDVYDSNLYLNEMTDNLSSVRNSMIGYLNTKSSQSMSDYYLYESKLNEMLEDFNDKPSGDYIKLTEKNIKSITKSYLDCTDRAIEAKRGRNVERYRYYYDESESLYTGLGEYIYALNNTRFADNADNYKSLYGSLQFIEFICIVIFVMTAIMGIVLVSIICNSITEPLTNLAHAAEEVAAGNYEVNLYDNGSTDEVGLVTSVFNTMVSSVSDNIVKLRESYEKEQKMKEKELLMEAHLKDARLKYLQAQINPHFLFNTLNAGAQLAMMEGADRAYEYIQQVASFFRYNIKKDNDIVSIREEIEMVDTYIYILNVRFSGEIGYEKELDESLLDSKVPCMCLQPIVENAVNYGIRGIDKRGIICLSVKRVDERICISIKDNGIGMSEERIREVLERRNIPNPDNTDSNGVGLDNVMARFELMYGDRQLLDIISEGEGKGTEVRLYFSVQDE